MVNYMFVNGKSYVYYQTFYDTFFSKYLFKNFSLQNLLQNICFLQKLSVTLRHQTFIINLTNSIIMIKTLRYFFVAALAMMSLSANATKIVFAELGLTNGVQYTDPFDGGDFTVTFSGGGNNGKYYDTGTGIRVYGGGVMTVAAKAGKVTSITVTYHGDNKPSDASVVNVGTYDPATGEWTGSSAEVAFTRPSGSGHWRIQSVDATISTSASDVSAPEFSVSSGMYFAAQQVELTCATEGATIYYNVNSEADPTASSTQYTGAITVSETSTIKAIAIKGEYKSIVRSNTYTIITGTEGAGTKESPFTVADALSIINVLEDGGTSPVVYTKGIVIGTVPSPSSGQVTFQIGATATASEADQIKVFRAKGLENENYAEGDTKAGDEVVICAPLQKYVSGETITPETYYGYIYSINGKTSKDPAVLEGNGTEANPFTANDLIIMTTAQRPTAAAWVKGYIMGSFKDGKTLDEAKVANIAIAKTADGTSYAPVELKAETIFRTKLNVVDNPGNIGKEVKLYGTITGYFNVTGVKNLEKAVLDGEVITGINTVKATSQKFSGKMYNVAGQVVNKGYKGLVIMDGKKIVNK